jgi:catechol 2,3-dioxygenase-like lactoylglutathione lyase family enzyme
MITSVHAMIYSDDPEATRAFLRDVLGWSYVDAGDGWLIFRSGPSEIGVHPTGGEWEGQSFSYPRRHSISLMCDDVQATMADLRAKGAEFSGEVEDHGYGLVAMLRIPGADDVQLYEPRHPAAYGLGE